MSSSNGIFNVQEPQGAEFTRAQTTAAKAQVTAPTSDIARKVEGAVDAAQGAAQNAAATAQAKGPALTGESPSALDTLQRQAQETTNAAVAEGKQDVEAAKSSGTGYLDQAKELASNAVSAVQQYLPGSDATTPKASQGSDSTVGNAATQLQASATAAVETAKEYYVSVAQPQVEKATGAAQDYLHSLQGQGSTAKVGDTNDASHNV
ncbi:hypothetical protein ARMSODRAFT_948589 [Armillaria solidipes]|uniref:Uncharacterized protein n=1 Tax=Armillaria solidipes TaxID=1076256 RepID=A0A2H3C4C7_9AGAR|nr:hypothetical protein ARMSODRAFT_948589 [Armillaria solidipes]